MPCVCSAAPFVRDIGAALAGIEKAEEVSKSREFRLWVGEKASSSIRCKTICTGVFVLAIEISPAALPSTGTSPVGTLRCFAHSAPQLLPHFPPCSVLTAKEAAPMACSKDPSVSTAAQFERLSGFDVVQNRGS